MKNYKSALICKEVVLLEKAIAKTSSQIVVFNLIKL